MGSDAANAASPRGPSARPSVLPGQLSEEQAAVYDRQLRVWGVEAQKRLGASRFFVAGLTGLAAEACKNVVLAGIGTMLLYEDGVPVGEAAPGNFLAAAGAAEDATTSVAAATAATLREMNPFCNVEVVAGDGDGFAGVTADSLTGCDVVLVCGAPLTEAARINEACRSVGAAFFAADCRSSSANFFADLGAAFTYTVPKTVPGGAKDAAGDPHEQDRRTSTFVPLRQAMASKWSAMGENREGGLRRVNKLAAAYLHCAAFEGAHGRRPAAGDVPALVEGIAAAEVANGVKPGWLPTGTLEDFVGVDGCEMPAVAAVVGGILGQELLRAVTGKGEPVRNAFFFTMANSQGTIENIGCPP